MGLIGWADAPNSIEENKGEIKMRAPSAPGLAAGSEPLTWHEPSQSDSPLFDNTLTDSMPIADGEDGKTDVSAFIEDEEASGLAVEDQRSPNDELLLAIRNLRLAGNEDEGRYDISKFELHEIKFLFEHAERIGGVDYFVAVREVFGVKHRILDKKVDIDAVSSPNLDELMAFVEGKYEDSFGGGNL